MSKQNTEKNRSGSELSSTSQPLYVKVVAYIMIAMLVLALVALVFTSSAPATYY